MNSYYDTLTDNQKEKLYRSYCDRNMYYNVDYRFMNKTEIKKYCIIEELHFLEKLNCKHSFGEPQQRFSQFGDTVTYTCKYCSLKNTHPLR